ncbi:hypothetical protein JSO59_000995 [Riemerella anatipestifer]|uniref:hypothetical protein n=1 Tax=Riemerella anatipestifer TaxID=34085 RepID=UPI002A8E2407|nr:hypothetical protein [Riemerella anatipestifer]
MKLRNLFYLAISLFFLSCKTNIQNQKKYIYYLHGRIIEIQGKNAVSEEFGKYEFDNIVKALKVENSEVIAEIRNENVDYLEYANKVSNQVDSLISLGINPKNITIIGASKGAIIASNISSINPNPINYIFLAGNNDYQEEHNDWKFHGQILCFYDDSDNIAGKNYDYWKNKLNFTSKFEQIKIDKNIGHGFLYKPYREWIEPTRKWILHQKL